jgi:3-hydroxyisobutyrate dehydrogenase-like beta-hydroxyacid dehydrogenase
MVATSEAVVMGVKSGLDPKVMIDVINAGSGLNTASRDKFPRSVLPRSFDFGFATALEPFLFRLNRNGGSGLLF